MTYISYISQTIVFALALMGTLFKSTKTDADGKTIYTASGLPALTTTGTVVVTLLSISFIISLTTIWHKNKSEQEARDAQKEVKIYNSAVKNTLDQVFEKTSQLSDEQKRRFEAVLTEQQNTGADIRTSADLLKNRIESSSTVLTGKMGTSIGLLNHSVGVLASLADPIGEIRLGYLFIEIPFTDPALQDYRDRRLEPAIRTFLASPGTNPYHLKRLEDRDAWRKPGVMICANSPLLPNKSTEPVAYNLLGFVNAYILLDKKHVDKTQLLDPNEIPDLTVHIARRLNRSSDPSDCGQDPNFSVMYDIEKHRAYVSINDLTFYRPALTGPERPRAVDLWESGLQLTTKWTKAVDGKISGVPDLAAAELIVQLGRFLDGRDVDVEGNPYGPANGDHIRSLIRIREQSKMGFLKLVFSGEVTIFLQSQEEAIRVGPLYLFHTPRMVRDGRGSYYAFRIPTSLPGLLPWGPD